MYKQSTAVSYAHECPANSSSAVINCMSLTGRSNNSFRKYSFPRTYRKRGVPEEGWRPPISNSNGRYSSLSLATSSTARTGNKIRNSVCQVNLIFIWIDVFRGQIYSLTGEKGTRGLILTKKEFLLYGWFNEDHRVWGAKSLWHEKEFHGPH
jgi:hypothetical protein